MDRVIPVENDILVIVPESYTNTKQGSFFEKLCADILRKQSYNIIGMEVRRTGMEIDITAEHNPSGSSVYVECKFYNSKNIDSTIVDLCYAQATRAKIKRIALFSTAKLGKDAQGAYDEYRQMDGCDYSFYGRKEILDALISSGKVQSYKDVELKPNITHATLIIHPELEFTWIFQEMDDGVASRLLAYNGSNQIDCSKIRSVLDTKNLFESIPVYPFNTSIPDSSSNSAIVEKNSREVVSSILVADDIMDYKPCKPSDFVGRDAIQKELWDYFEAVRNNDTDTRILSLVGASGHGKSSLVAFLSERFRNIKWKNKFFLYPVDVRSARGARFVAEAIVKGFTKAIDEKFIELGSEFKVDNIEDITSGNSFIECLKYLNENNKVIVFFFDQFEEVFMKEELFGLFRAFERFAKDVSSDNMNLVVGFSWRSGITLGEENPAYSMWSQLKDRRIDKKIEDFDVSDSSKMITTFEKSIGIKLNKSLRKRLIQQSQGYPWLLKKLCIHIFKKIKNNVSQEELLITQFQIRSLFEEDLDRPDKEIECLKYVASNSPIDHYQTTKEFGQQTVYNLTADRLLIKTGEKISVYWDVFRDYLNTNETPVIPWSYMPNATVNMTINVLNYIKKEESISFEKLMGISEFKKGTLANVIMDLQSFSLIEKNTQGNYKAVQANIIPEEVIRRHLKDHLIYINISTQKNPHTGFCSNQQYTDLINSEYSNKNGKTPKGYATKILNWLQYAGLITKGGNKLTVYSPTEYSPEYGALGVKEYLFLAATTPQKSLDLISALIQKELISFDEQSNSKLRNSVSDLVSLGICKRNEDSSIELMKSVNKLESPEQILAQSLIKSETVIVIREILKSGEHEREVLAEKFKKALNKPWKDTSSKRYLNGMLKYMDFLNSYNNALQRTN
jgi:Holliday junction resolvase-like predicted endonuclease/Holliday junction resolvasome RuvABC ATP-dependent DNA helicase subunit